MSNNIISLNDRRKDDGKFCASITLYSDGRVVVDKDVEQMATRTQVAWALANFALGIADLVEYRQLLGNGEGS